jgi:uncharacterized phage protein gp47/JayE
VADETNTNARFKTQKEIVNTTNTQKAFSAEVVAEEIGPIHVKAGSLTKIVTPHADLISVNNPEDAVIGRLMEMDEELRIRPALKSLVPLDPQPAAP